MLPYSELLIRLALAAVLGSLIGFERERQLWAAGLRTHMLVSVGACLVMIVSAYGFQDVIGQDHVVLDPSRMAAQVISGVGFLGAGAILMRGEVVRGLTTAASVWAVATIGLAAGGGLYVAATATTFIILIILAGIKPIGERYKDRHYSCTLNIQTKRGSMSIDMLKSALGTRTSRVKQFVIQPGSEEFDDVIVSLARIHPKDVHDIIAHLKELPGVFEVKQENQKI